MHTLLFLEPSHFHAALCLRDRDPRVHRDVHAYARPGPELRAFVEMIDAFNRRPDQPTDWAVRVHESEDPLGLLIEERRSANVILANRNNVKLPTLARLHAAGFHVLADKPWLIDVADLPNLERVTGAPPLAMDMMTLRFDTHDHLLTRIVGVRSLFGDFVAGDRAGPAIEIGAVHHLCKQVDGRPLRRPVWYYDVAVQGDGVVDVQSHLTDQAQWLVAGNRELEYGRDVRLLAASRGETAVDLELFRESTGETRFPAALRDRVVDGTLGFACNSSIDYVIDGVRVRQWVEWRAREPEHGGDMYEVRLRGSRCNVTAANRPDTGYRMELRLEPRPGADLEEELAAAVATWAIDLPGLRHARAGSGFELIVPEILVTSHDRQFPLLLGAFLDSVESGGGWGEIQSRIRLRYTLLAHAREMALGQR